MEENHIVEVENLYMYFPVTAGILRRRVADVKAVDGLNFFIKKGETLGLVGESGCGKTTTGRCILQLYEGIKGKVSFDGVDLTNLKKEQMRRMRRNMQLIFQDPFASLDPRMTAGEIIGEPLKVHRLARGKEYKEQVEELFRMVELEPYMANRYPHEFSGGQRQRIGIARALAVRPKFVVCDEPVSALDVSIQAQIITLLERLREELGLTYLFIAHDLSVVRNISDRVAVMYLGKIVEITDSDELYANPLHPYTIALLSAVPIPDPQVDRTRQRIILKGDVPSPINPPSGCRFHPRCQMAIDICKQKEPELKLVGKEHWVSCHLVKPQAGTSDLSAAR
ncbi:MAG: ATP-binding cassette domain-containing protein [Dehalococcoidales bacterium]|nr:ATP-binding cassette domain-containing protein [Dehalococcoidales bacterium]